MSKFEQHRVFTMPTVFLQLICQKHISSIYRWPLVSQYIAVYLTVTRVVIRIVSPDSCQYKLLQLTLS